MLVGTHIRKIADSEGFEVEIYKDGRLLANHETESGLKDFNRAYSKSSKSSWTVNEWKEKKFKPINPAYTVKVFYADGNEAVGQTKLSTVRESYEGDNGE